MLSPGVQLGNRYRLEVKLREDLRGLDGMIDVGFAAASHLPRVRATGILVGVTNQLDPRLRQVALDGLNQLGEVGVNADRGGTATDGAPML